jgi:hypothetical protein
MTDEPWRGPSALLASIDTPWNLFWGHHVERGLGFHLQNPEGRFERLTGIGVAPTRLGLLASLESTALPTEWVEYFTNRAWFERRDLFTGEPERRYCISVEHGQIAPGPYPSLPPQRTVDIYRFIHAVELVDGLPAPRTMCGLPATDVRAEQSWADSAVAEKHEPCRDAVSLNLGAS